MSLEGQTQLLNLDADDVSVHEQDTGVLHTIPNRTLRMARPFPPTMCFGIALFGFLSLFVWH